MRRHACLAALLLLTWPATAQPVGSGAGDFTATVTGVPAQVIPPANAATRTEIFFQVAAGVAVACRADGVPGFTGGSLVLGAAAGTPPIGGSAVLQGAMADPRPWVCVAYPPGGTATATLTAKAYP